MTPRTTTGRLSTNLGPGPDSKCERTASADEPLLNVSTYSHAAATSAGLAPHTSISLRRGRSSRRSLLGVYLGTPRAPPARRPVLSAADEPPALIRFNGQRSADMARSRGVFAGRSVRAFCSRHVIVRWPQVGGPAWWWYM